MKSIISIVLVAALSGCVVAPAHRPSVAVQVTTPMYPLDEAAYIWDPRFSLFFFYHSGQRYYMPKDWRYRANPPRGHYHGHQENGHWRHQ